MLPKAGCDPRIRQQILEDIEKLDDYQRIESKYYWDLQLDKLSSVNLYI